MDNKRSRKDIIDIFTRVLKLSNFRFNKKSITEFWKTLMRDIQFFVENQEEVFKAYNDQFGYKDYYDSNQSPEEMVNLIDTLEFCIFCLSDELEGIRCILSDNSIPKEDKTNMLEEMIPRLSFWVNHTKDLFQKRDNTKSDNENIVLPFEVDPTYRIFFSGSSLEDIQTLPINVVNKLIRKLSDTLAQSLLISNSQQIEHIKEKYNCSFSRIKLDISYRIVYTRHGQSTIVFGISKKTGKDNEYTRYDICAERVDKVYDEAEQFCRGVDTEYNKNTYKYLRNVHRQALREKDEKEEEEK